MIKDNPSPTKKILWSFSQFFNFVMLSFYDIHTWLFPTRKMIYEENEAGLLLRDSLEKKDFLGKLSSGWVELSFGYKLLFACGVGLTCFIAIGFVAPIACLLFSLVGMIGIHIVLVAHEHHRRELTQSMVKQVINTQQNLEAQQGVFKHAYEKTCDMAEKLKECLNVIAKGAEEVKKELSDIKELEEIRAQGAEKIVEQQKKLTDKMQQLDGVLDKETETVNHFTEIVSSFEQAVTSFDDTQKKYAQAVTESSFFVTKQPKDRLEDEKQLEKSINMLDEAIDVISGVQGTCQTTKLKQ